MNTSQTLTPQNCIEILTNQPGTLQHGFVTGYSNRLISQPRFAQPPVIETDAFCNLVLDIEPNSGSAIFILHISFVAEQTAYAPVEYSDGNGYASKPISHYAPLMDLLRSDGTGSRRIEVLLQVNDDGQNTLVIF
jgi:hypothetical protein